MKKKISISSILVYAIIIICVLVTVIPFINIIAVSFSSYEAYLDNPMRLLPKDLNLSAYKEILGHNLLYSSYMNTIVVTICTIFLSLFIYVTGAYSLSRKGLKGKGFFMTLIVFTMMFNGGIVPNYYLIKSLNLYNSLWALIFTGAFSAFNLILMKNFFESLPNALIEAAKVDGANEPTILFRIVLPLSKPILATIALYTAVGSWNNFFNAVIYIKDTSKWPLMLLLREIIMGASMQEIASGGNILETADKTQPIMLQYATLLIVMVPILCIYPFLQKHFVKGVTVGAVKG